MSRTLGSADDGGVKTFAQIGKELGVTHQRAQQIYSKAIAKLRRKPLQLERLKLIAREVQQSREQRAHAISLSSPENFL